MTTPAAYLAAHLPPGQPHPTAAQAGDAPATVAELRAVCQRRGLVECDTRHFISRSVSAGEKP